MRRIAGREKALHAVSAWCCHYDSSLWAPVADDSKPAVAPALVAPGGNRYKYAVEFASKAAPCKVTTADSACIGVTWPQGPELIRAQPDGRLDTG